MVEIVKNQRSFGILRILTSIKKAGMFSPNKSFFKKNELF